VLSFRVKAGKPFFGIRFGDCEYNYHGKHPGSFQSGALFVVLADLSLYHSNVVDPQVGLFYPELQVTPSLWEH
jgi:hypothetical protein